MKKRSASDHSNNFDYVAAIMLVVVLWFMLFY